ncbi:MAG TPA: CAP domain-containing protein [Pyrinomonadaceae bacterium]|nr:CAP domain-containing protein [Pyrinomonadaceae bacterium]
MLRLLPITVFLLVFLAIPAFGQEARLITSVRPVAVKTTPAAPVEPNDIEKRAFEQTNLVRVKNGLQPLTWDNDVCRMARIHSESMSRNHFFSHVTPEGMRLKDRARAAGILQFSTLGENIAYTQGYDNPAVFIVEQWMQSAKHRANILSNDFRAMAIGSFVGPDGSIYLTQTFITR